MRQPEDLAGLALAFLAGGTGEEQEDEAPHPSRSDAPQTRTMCERIIAIVLPHEDMLAASGTVKVPRYLCNIANALDNARLLDEEAKLEDQHFNMQLLQLEEEKASPRKSQQAKNEVVVATTATRRPSTGSAKSARSSTTSTNGGKIDDAKRRLREQHEARMEREKRMTRLVSSARERVGNLYGRMFVGHHDSGDGDEAASISPEMRKTERDTKERPAFVYAWEKMWKFYEEHEQTRSGGCDGGSILGSAGDENDGSQSPMKPTGKTSQDSIATINATSSRPGGSCSGYQPPALRALLYVLRRALVWNLERIGFLVETFRIDNDQVYLILSYSSGQRRACGTASSSLGAMTSTAHDHQPGGANNKPREPLLFREAQRQGQIAALNPKIVDLDAFEPCHPQTFYPLSFVMTRAWQGLARLEAMVAKWEVELEMRDAGQEMEMDHGDGPESELQEKSSSKLDEAFPCDPSGGAVSGVAGSGMAPASPGGRETKKQDEPIAAEDVVPELGLSPGRSSDRDTVSSRSSSSAGGSPSNASPDIKNQGGQQPLAIASFEKDSTHLRIWS
ncbi:unnamed protein product [Amoebophrya sp. A25]|nr:unnamed protein product [Amoebophrya sp. A25]|eukprot:GSA25T00017873001.1